MDQIKIKYYYEAYVDMVYKLGFTYMKNKTDTEDVVQEVFLRLVRQQKRFESDEHVKAWLIVTTSNYCKSQLTHWWSKRTEINEGNQDNLLYWEDEEQSNVLEAVMSLPVQLKTPIYLYYYEGYTSEEIAKVLNKPAGTIRNYLYQGRNKIKVFLQEGDNNSESRNKRCL